MTAEQLSHNNSTQASQNLNQLKHRELNLVHQKGLMKGLAYHSDCLGLLLKIKAHTHANWALTFLFAFAYTAISVKTFPSIPLRCEIGSIIAPTGKSTTRLFLGN